MSSKTKLSVRSGNAKDAILTTIYNRDEIVLMNTIGALLKNDLSHTVIIIVDDGSDDEHTYPMVRQILCKAKADGLCDFVWHTMSNADHPKDTYYIPGTSYNNPSAAFQVAYKIAKWWKCERVFVLSSDVQVPPTAVAVGRQYIDQGSIFCGRVINMSDSSEWLSSRRIWPLYWWMGMKMEDLIAIGGWDLEYMKGIAFEDNDFSARIFLQVGQMVVDDSVTSYHQSHAQTAYSDELKGWKVNRDFTFARWKGANPFESQDGPVRYHPRPIKPGVTYILSDDALAKAAQG